MKKIVALMVFCAAFFAGLYGQSAAADAGAKRVLYVYEEGNANTDPWRGYFREEMKAAGFEAEEVPAAELGGKDLSKYDLIVIHGAVMAFTSNEPIRDWLEKGPDLSGRKVALFVTANRWFLDKYNKQLTDLLGKRGAVTVDAVSAATKKLGEADKKELVKKHIGAVK